MRTRGVFIGIAVLLALPAFSAEEETHPPIVISELLWSGTDLSTADEWIELTNTGTGDVNIGGWILTKLSTGAEEDMLVLPEGSIVGSGTTFLISNYHAANSRLDIEPDFVDTAVTLANTQLLIRLYVPNAESGRTLIDTVNDGIGAPFAGSNAVPKASMERIDLQGAGDAKENWQTATTFLHFDDGAALFGTPKAPNGTGPSTDIFPPKEATLFSAEACPVMLSGALSLSKCGDEARIEVSWVPSISLDLASQELSFTPDINGSSGITFSASSTGVTFTDGIGEEPFLFTLRSKDVTGNTSSGVTTISTTFPDIRITEVLANPIGEDTEEWIELGNFGGETVDIGGWILDEGNSPTAFTIPSPFPLDPTAHVSFRKSQTGLPLDNRDETLSLRRGSTLMDNWTYPETAEEVSYGRSGTGTTTFQPFCVPTESSPNEDLPSDPKITIQSGEVAALGSVTLNLIAEVMTGSTVHATCHWDYGDGFTSESCNPPSHTFNALGTYEIHLTYTDFCGDTAERTLTASVTEETSSSEPPPVSGGGGGGTRGVGSSGGGGRTSCAPTATVGIRVSEFLPNPLGSDTDNEWIELQNTIPTTVSLCGWELDDAEGGSSPHFLDSYTIGPEGYLLLPITRTHISVNNSDEHIRLFGPGRFLFDDIAFAESRENESFARQENGGFAWTTLLTPGEKNRFGTPLRSSGSFAGQAVIISAALPNPDGVDEGNEWIEITNVGDALIDLTGFSLDDAEGGSAPYRIAGLLLAPKATHRFPDSETKITLTNTEDTVRLLDSAGNIVSTLSWKNAASGQIVSATPFASEVPEGPETGSGADLLFQKVYVMQVIFSEVMSNPPLNGELREIGEYIELYNPTEEPAFLEDWILDDAPNGSSAARRLGPEIIVPARSYLLLPSSKTHISLNNEGETISLTSPDSAVSISMSYPEMERGEAYAFREVWCLTTLPTPGRENICRKIFSETKNEQRKTYTTNAPLSSPLSTLRTKYRPLFAHSTAVFEEDTPVPPLLAALVPKMAREDLPPVLTLTGIERSTPLFSDVTSAVLILSFFCIFVTLEALSRMKNAEPSTVIL